MSPGRPPAANDNGEPPSQKRSSSLAGFFSKILPSNRPEQGGTRRTIDETRDNGSDINELTRWNLAKEKNPIQQTSATTLDESSHRRVFSWSPQKGDSRFVENLPRESSCGREQIPDIQDSEPLPPRKSEALTRAEVHELLKSKEEARRNRRSLKESGDWLGVQGADPYSGEYAVLTPTDTLSSDATPSSTRSKLARLARKKKAARLEYEQIRLLEEQEKDKARLEKEQAKLNKIERVKEELRRQQQSTKWIQHKRQWSSAAEPNLSPIAQSLDSVAIGSSETSSLLSSELSTDSLSSDPDDPTTTVPNFSRPTRPPVSTKAAQAERLSCDGPRSRAHRRLDKSTDTIIHNSPDARFDPVSLMRPVTQPPGTHLNAGQPEIGRAKSERHFLWRRRRETDPGKSVSNPPVSFMMSMAARNRTSSSIEYVQKDHFADLAIPDYHLHLLSPEPIDSTDSQSIISEESPSAMTDPSLLEAVGGNRMALASTTNLVLFQEHGQNSPEVNGATVTSSQSKLKEIMKRSSIRLKLVPSLLTTAHAKDTERNHQMPPLLSDEIQGHIADSPSEDIQACHSQHQQSDLLGRVSLEQPDEMSPPINKKPVRRESVSIPITTTTGYAPDQQNQHSSLKSHNVGPNRIDDAVSTTNTPTAPTSLDRHECYMATASTPEERRTPSPPITPQNGLLKHEPVQETLGTDIISPHRVTLEKKPPTRVSTPTTPRLCRLVQQNMEMGDPDMARHLDIIERTETVKIQIPDPTEASETNTPDGQARRISQERQKSPALLPAVVSQETHRSLSIEEEMESMVEETAQIAELHSRAKKIVGRKSKTRKEVPNSSHGPSPGKVKKHLPGSKMAEPKHLPQQRRLKKKRHSEEGAGIGLLSRYEQARNNTAQVRGKKSTTDDVDTPETTMTVVQSCNTAYMLLLGLVCTWWIMVRPAFDQRSDLWRRQHRKQSTWEDVAVFISAGAFCLAGAVGCWYALKVPWWVIGRIEQRL
ncbi:hypothetical protein F5Y05DRAFT_409428 [Hypoxylon sp. FL0543]|nr:hypothetical protein F5Y05DRAFT_409428 [Hypoxylon sp. FL0543]